jgi:tetratricopeptide (TPR) repeat protein
MSEVLRATAVLRITLPGKHYSEQLALDAERNYFFDLAIDGKNYSGGDFLSPFGDERWQEFVRDLRAATEGRGGRHTTDGVRDAGRRLYNYLCSRSSDLANFLRNTSGPRRLVIETQRAEIHQLPWEAMVDENWVSLAERDLSVVHSSEGFNPAPESLAAALHIQPVFGPGTEAKTAAGLALLREEVARHQSEKIHIAEPVEPQAQSHEWFDQLTAEIIHIEAHGDPATGETALPERVAGKSGSLDAGELALAVRGRKMVLLWSCFSAAMHSWGTSLAQSLHRADNAFVVGFSTPLLYDSSDALATRFYQAVFTDRKVADPETAIVKQRAALYTKALNSGEWASLVLWLRHPIDTSRAALEGPRLPAGPAEWTEQTSDSFARLAEIFANSVVSGRTVVVLGENVEGPVPRELVKAYDGPVVHLRGRNGLENDTLFKELGVEDAARERIHPGDRFLTVLDALASYERSLLLWSGVSEREVALFALLTRVPDRLAIVLTSPDADVAVDPGIVVLEAPSRPNPPSKEPKFAAGVSALVELMEEDRFLEAAKIWKTLEPKAKTWKHEAQIPFFREGYWALIRTGEAKAAEECIRSLARLDEFEALLVDGNLLDRKGQYREAVERYARAEQLARNPRDVARSLVERAYVTYELRDFLLAETLHGKSLALLQTVDKELRDSTWRSAYGRVLRDFADAISRDPARAEQADAYLRRAMAVHAIDGRLNQVAAVLQTRGKLAHTLGKGTLAEQFLQNAAVLFLKVNNRAGWAYTAWWLARLASEDGHLEQAQAILSNCYDRLREENGYPLDKGRVALSLARAYWNQGKLGETARWSAEALRIFPEGRRQERKEAAALASFCRSLLPAETLPFATTRNKK